VILPHPPFPRFSLRWLGQRVRMAVWTVIGHGSERLGIWTWSFLSRECVVGEDLNGFWVDL
jgi:hypothetical protein